MLQNGKLTYGPDKIDLQSLNVDKERINGEQPTERKISLEMSLLSEKSRWKEAYSAKNLAQKDNKLLHPPAKNLAGNEPTQRKISLEMRILSEKSR